MRVSIMTSDECHISNVYNTDFKPIRDCTIAIGNSLRPRNSSVGNGDPINVNAKHLDS